MRKIHILKAIVDFIFIITMLIAITIVIFISPLFIYGDLWNINLEIIGINLTFTTVFDKILISIGMLSYILLIYSLFLFRRVLRYFLQRKIFHIYVINTFQKIGVLLIISGLTTLIISFISGLYFMKKAKFEIGIGEHFIILSLGLFFMVLSEIFKIAKNAKEENDLTV